MKTGALSALMTLVLSAWANVATAATGREDNSSLAMWVFLGFCALIVVAQLIPAIFSAREAARAEKLRRAQPVTVEATRNEGGKS